ncbi:putative ABC exporter domain-containing protein [Inconstantimicrobium mannanitabidum]|uniref:ABC transporter permease n=1 Tax=Inconstantimicrobium mannanitabidum TaxID=1604901 RepID=A0ACB5R899_9CLOT|nr:putative ABC exporter domain-containing protein [Clostridium sp. TW13]GKX65252.1 ABC transporter permease [Clostridium sp. TW13]
MKNSGFKDFLSLAYIEITKYKNRVIESFRHPLTAIKTMGSFLFPFIVILFLYTRKNGGGYTLLQVIIKPHILSAIIMLILLLIFMLTIYNSVAKYNPSQFESADVNYLFPSPISPRTIYAWTIIRKCIKGLIGSILLVVVMVITVSRVSEVHIFKLIYVIIAILLFPILQNALIFLVYTISNRFNLGKLIKYCILSFAGVIVFHLIYNTVGSKNILDTVIDILNEKFFSTILIVGWLRDMLIAPFVANKAPFIQTVVLVVITTAMLFCAIYFADDYYEEAGEDVGYHEKIVDTHSSTIYDIVDNLEDSKKSKTVEAFNIKELRGPWAFIWKSSIINKRTAKKGGLIGYAIALIASGVMCYFLRGKEFSSFYPLFILVFLQGAISSAQISSPLKYEIKKQYLFLLPGSAAAKLLALHVKPIINNVITDTLMLLPIVFFTETSILQVVLLWLIAVVIIILCYLSTVIIILVTPPNDNGKNLIIQSLVSYVMFAPAIAVTALIVIYLKNVMLALSMFVIISIVIIIIILRLSDFLFSKIELR